MLFIGTFATADGLMVAFITLGLLALVLSATDRVRPHHILLLTIALAGAALAKSAMAVVPLMIVGGALLFGRRALGLGRRYLLWCLLAALLAAAAFAAWLLPCNAATGGKFVARHFGRHVGDRATRPLEGHGGNVLLWLPFYLPVVLGGFAPWAPLLGGGLSTAIGKRLAGARGRALLLGAVVPVFVAFSLVATKLAHYVLPIWPGLALIVGGTLERARRGELHPRDRRWLRGGLLLTALFTLTCAVVAAVGPWFLTLPDLRLAGAVAAVPLAGVALATAWAWRRRRATAAAVAMAAGMALTWCALAAFGHPAFEAERTVPRFAREIADAVGPDGPIAVWGFGEPSLVFYAGRPLRNLDAEKARERAVLRWLREPGGGALVTVEARLPGLRKRYGGPLDADVIATARHLNTGNGKVERLLAIRRGTLGSLPPLAGSDTGRR